MPEINTWLSQKIVHMRIINDKIDFTKFDEEAERQNEIWMPAIKLKPGLYSDTGYRFRENLF